MSNSKPKFSAGAVTFVIVLFFAIVFGVVMYHGFSDLHHVNDFTQSSAK